ncbi:MAG: glycosyltransferase family 87 protein [Brevefilum sp.]|nr:glycosyltransferase family 87 protein [Brevefilum sp.]
MKRYQKTKISQYLILSLILASLAAAGFASMFVMQRIPFEDHFVLNWAAGRAWLLEGINPYDEAEILQRAEEAIVGSDFLAILPAETVQLNPFLNMVFYLPFSLIPYQISRMLWVMTLTIGVLLIGYLSLLIANWKITTTAKIIILLAGLLWIPGITTIITGQLSPIVILLLLISLYLFLQGQDNAAGFILALTSGSFYITGLVIILFITYAIIKRRWSLVTAYSAGLVFLVIVSLLLLPTWPRDWLIIVVENYENLNLVQTPLMTLASLLPGIEDFLSIFLHIIFGTFYIFLLIRLRSKSERVFVWNALAALVVASLLNIRGSVVYLFLLLPAILLVFRFLTERLGLFGRIITWIFIGLLIAIPWYASLPVELITASSSLSSVVIWLPILVIIGMNWIRWWAVKIPKLPF